MIFLEFPPLHVQYSMQFLLGVLEVVVKFLHELLLSTWRDIWESTDLFPLRSRTFVSDVWTGCSTRRHELARESGANVPLDFHSSCRAW